MKEKTKIRGSILSIILLVFVFAMGLFLAGCDTNNSAGNSGTKSLIFTPIEGTTNASVKASNTEITTAEIPTSVKIGKTTYIVTTIEDSAFSGCQSLASVTLPERLTEIGENAFSGCTSLTSATFKNVYEWKVGETSIASKNLASTSTATTYLTENYLANKWTCPEVPEVIADTVQEGGFDVVKYNYGGFTFGFNEETFEAYVKRTGTAIHGERTIPARILKDDNVYYVTRIGEQGFYRCYSEDFSIIMPESITSIGSRAFKETTLTSIKLSPNLVSIEDYAFQRSKSLTSIEIPASVTSIGSYAFEESSGNFTSVTFEERTQSTNLEIKQKAFSNCWGLESVTNIPKGTSFEVNVFSGCRSLKSIVIPEGVTNITGFRECYSLESVTIPSTATSIEGSAFSDCKALKSVNIPEGVTNIGTEAFHNCYSLEAVTIPSTMTSIGDRAFEECHFLTSIVIPEGVASIGIQAFCKCYSLTSVTIPSTMTSIGNQAFNDCKALFEIYNLSSLAITAGSSDYGEIATCAKVIHTDLSAETRIIEDNGIKYYVYGSDYIALAVLDSSITSIKLNSSCTGASYYAFYCCESLETVYFDTEAIASEIESDYKIGYIAKYPTTIYVKSDIANIGKYITENFTTTTSDVEGYAKYVRNVESD